MRNKITSYLRYNRGYIGTGFIYGAFFALLAVLPVLIIPLGLWSLGVYIRGKVRKAVIARRVKDWHNGFQAGARNK